LIWCFCVCILYGHSDTGFYIHSLYFLLNTDYFYSLRILSFIIIPFLYIPWLILEISLRIRNA
jgi:hypothetical protein